jgi:hypothetical protein
MNRHFLKQIPHGIEWGLWFLFFFLLPVTSFPWMTALKISSMVAPPSVLILAVLILVWFIPYLLRSGQLPVQSIPLILFGLVGIAASILSIYQPVPPFRDNQVIRVDVEAFITLGVGIALFLLVAVWAQDRARLRFALRIINWTGLVVMLWSLVQFYYLKTLGHYPQWMWDIESFFSSGRLYEGRVTGLAFEPSWHAHQLNMLYLPFWLAATVTGSTAHAHRLWKISLENVLLAIGAFVLFITLSRVGLLAFMLMIAFMIFYANIKLIGWLQRKILAGSGKAQTRSRFAVVGLTVVMSLLLVVIYAAGLLGLGYGLSKVDYRMAQLFDVQFLKEASFVQYANRLVFAERIVFWEAGWGAFNARPLFGVGLGNAGFFFQKTLSSYSWALTEVRTVMYQASAVPNIKNLWVRVLAETGVVGFAFFLSWLFGLWQSARIVRASSDRFIRSFGWAGSFVIVGLLVEGFSVDTFALPYYWVSLGLLAAACELVRHQWKENQRIQTPNIPSPGGNHE